MAREDDNDRQRIIELTGELSLAQQAVSDVQRRLDEASADNDRLYQQLTRRLRAERDAASEIFVGYLRVPSSPKRSAAIREALYRYGIVREVIDGVLEQKEIDDALFVDERGEHLQEWDVREEGDPDEDDL